MKESGIVQTVIILILLAAAESCEVSKNYSNRLFKQPAKQNAGSANVKFLQPDSISSSEIKENTSEKKITTEETLNIISSQKEKSDSIKNKPVGVRSKKIRQ